MSEPINYPDEMSVTILTNTRSLDIIITKFQNTLYGSSSMVTKNVVFGIILVGTFSEHAVKLQHPHRQVFYRSGLLKTF